jgi:hypothetical protein
MKENFSSNILDKIRYFILGSLSFLTTLQVKKLSVNKQSRPLM